MANLLNAIPQASNKISSSLDAKNPAKLEGKELKDLFQKKLSESVSAVDSEEKPIESIEDLGEVALVAGAVAAPKIAPVEVAPIELKKVGSAETVEVKNIKDPKNIINQKLMNTGIQVQNQLPVNEKGIPVKAAVVKQNGVSIAQGVNQPANIELASAVAGEDLLSLSQYGDVDVESVDLKNLDGKPTLPKEVSSKLSTADFLNLREISQNPVKPNLALAQSPVLADPAKLAPLSTSSAVVMGMKPTPKQKSDEKQSLAGAMNGLSPAHGEKQIFGKTLDATVTPGAKPVLSQATLANIGNQVNLLGQAKQDGEIKMRLRPDHLGELQMSVRTQGQNVSIQIRAENNEAKKIIEDSLGALREHLSQQNLSLARIDVVTQTTSASNLEQTQMQFDSNQNFNQSSTNEGGRNHSQDGSQQSGRDFYREEPSYVTAQPTMIRPKSADSTRLDLIA